MNASRGPVVDEAALVEHLKVNPMFRVGLDVFEVITCISICQFELLKVITWFLLTFLWVFNRMNLI